MAVWVVGVDCAYPARGQAKRQRQVRPNNLNCHLFDQATALRPSDLPRAGLVGITLPYPSVHGLPSEVRLCADATP